MSMPKFASRLTAFLLTIIALHATGQSSPTAGATQAASPAPTRFSVIVEGPPVGNAPDVILIPGLGSSREVYAAEARLLAPIYRLHRIQVAGFAGEPAGPNGSGPILAPVVEQLHQYIAANHIEHSAIIGHSLGGLLALMLAGAHPEDAGKLLIVDSLPFYGLVFSPNATVDMLRPQAQSMHDSLIAMTPDQFAASQPLFASRLVASAEGQKIVAAGSIASDRTVFANAMLEDLLTDLRPRLAGIKTPATVLYAYSSAQGKPSEVEALYTAAYAGMPNVHFTRIDNSLHFIMLDQPAAFHAAVISFLEPAANKP